MVDQDQGEPIAGVPLRIEGTELITQTDEQGGFVFEGVPERPVVILVEGPVVEASRLTINVVGQTGPLVISVPFASAPDYEVTVTGPRPALVTASSQRVTAREMAAAPRRTAEDALRLVPGLTVVQHGSEGKGHQFFLRGFDAVHGADLALSLEGMPINEWSNIHAQGYVDLGFIIPELVESVTVTKGPFAVGQGAFAMAGSADYQLGIPEGDRGLRTSFGVGTTYRHRNLISYTPKQGDGQDFLAAETLHDDGFGQNRHIDRVALLGRHRLLDSPSQGTLALLATAYLARFELPGTLRNDDVEAGRVDFYDAYDRAGQGLSGRGLAALSYQWAAPGHDVQAHAYGGCRWLELLENYTGFLHDPVHGDRRLQQQDGQSFGASMAYDATLHRSVAIQIGAGVRGDVLDQQQEHLDQRQAPLGMDRDLSGVQTITHGLAGLRYEPIEALRLQGGARLDVAHVEVRDGLADHTRASGTRAAVSPRATAHWRVVEGWRLTAAYGRGYRPPEARAFTSFEPSVVGLADDLSHGGEPRMTVADAVELGTRIRLSRYLGAQWSGFATFVDRESVFDHVSGVNLELNTTRRLGTELEIHSHPLDWLGLSADVTYVDARFVESGNPVPMAPWLVGGLRGTVVHDGGLMGGIRFLALAPRNLPHGAHGAPLVALDGTVGYRLGWLRIDLEIENLLNLQNREGEYHYASHWHPGEPVSQLPVLHYVPAPPLNARMTLTAVL